MYLDLRDDDGDFYTWQASDTFAVHLSLKMVSKLTTHISQTHGTGAEGEIRGLLIGRRLSGESRTTVIDDFALLALPRKTSARQPKASEAFETTCNKAKAEHDGAIGFFICSREGTLNIAQRDAETLANMFPEDGSIALLVQKSKRKSDGALFYQEGGELQPRDFGFGFPFDAGQMLAGYPAWRYPDPIAYEETQTAESSEENRIAKSREETRNRTAKSREETENRTAKPYEEKRHAKFSYEEKRNAKPDLLPEPIAAQETVRVLESNRENRLRWLRLLASAALVVLCLLALQFMARVD